MWLEGLDLDPREVKSKSNQAAFFYVFIVTLSLVQKDDDVKSLEVSDTEQRNPIVTTGSVLPKGTTTDWDGAGSEPPTPQLLDHLPYQLSHSDSVCRSRRLVVSFDESDSSHLLGQRLLLTEP